MNQEETLINVIIRSEVKVTKKEERKHGRGYRARITPRWPRDRRVQPTVKSGFLCSLPQTGSISSW